MALSSPSKGGAAECNRVAGLVGLTGIYRAWIGTQAVPFNLSANVACYNTHGDFLSAKWPPAADLANPIGYDETGKAVDDSFWSGLDESGVLLAPTGITCSSWTNTGGKGGLGRTSETGPTWTNNGEDFCTATHHLLCIENP